MRSTPFELPRRQFLKGMSGTALALVPFFRNLQAQTAGNPAAMPKRFVFVMRANGLRPYGVVPLGLEHLGTDRDMRDKMVDRPLKDLTLNPSMASLEPFKDQLTIIQGLSSKVCKGPHGGHFGVLGAYTSGDHAPPRRATLDYELAQKFPGIFKHLAFHIGTEPTELFRYLSISAMGKNTRTPAYASPMLAYKDIFGTVMKGADAEVEAAANANLLDFLVDDVKRAKKVLGGSDEREKLDHYLHGFEALRERDVKLTKMGDVLEDGAPKVTDKYTSEIETHRLESHFDMAAASLITGLTNVVTIRADELESRFQGFQHERMKQISLHDIGHTADIEGMNDRFDSDWKSGREMRGLLRTFQMELIAGLAAKLKAVPEGNGTMLDNTLIVYMSDAGSAHHTGYQNMPLLVLGNMNGAFRTGRYLHYPAYNTAGHRVLANLHCSLLHAAGFPEDRYGDRDPGLSETIDQNGPLAELMA
ncbi:hypothetical protein HAHE_29360 [Haloferula helveola]|uniref:DUF1552 domain-containing protein n=1 Tax=Haloferula helveola TaxID=490095 RepID=A0ABM7RGQ3_9BACT|nr:hypothetical protein HAHE_29360 [Haloferula helveola]